MIFSHAERQREDHSLAAASAVTIKNGINLRLDRHCPWGVIFWGYVRVIQGDESFSDDVRGVTGGLVDEKYLYHRKILLSYGDDFEKCLMDVLPRLREVECQRPYAVAVRGEFNRKITRGARVKQNALGLLPAWFTGLLTQISENLIQIGG